MPSKPWKSVRGRRMRLTRLDECCSPLPAATPCASLVTKGFISTAYSPEVEEAEEISQRNAAGELCLLDPGCDELKYINVVITMCGVEPDVLSFVTNAPLVLDADGNSVGNRIKKGQACNVNFAQETWTDIPIEQCTNGVKEYGYFLLPCIYGGVLGDFTIENGALNLVINAKARSGAGWGSGPYNVDLGAGGTPGPLLTPWEDDDLMDLHRTQVPPPAETDGCVPMPALTP